MEAIGQKAELLLYSFIKLIYLFCNTTGKLPAPHEPKKQTKNPKNTSNMLISGVNSPDLNLDFLCTEDIVSGKHLSLLGSCSYLRRATD